MNISDSCCCVLFCSCAVGLSDMTNTVYAGWFPWTTIKRRRKKSSLRARLTLLSKSVWGQDFRNSRITHSFLARSQSWLLSFSYLKQCFITVAAPTGTNFMCPDSVVALRIGRRSIGRLTEDTARDTDTWIRAETVTMIEKGSRMEQLRVTIHATSLQACTTTDAAGIESVTGMSLTGEKAAGVSTNEGGVEPGPIAHPPRWVQPDLRCVF